MLNTTVDAIRTKFAALEPVLNERARRLWAAVEARTIGRGGITRVAETTGLSRITIRAGLRELDRPASLKTKRLRCGWDDDYLAKVLAANNVEDA